jgi:hypothetical protein
MNRRSVAAAAVRAAADLAAASKAFADAQRRLARASSPGDPWCVVAPAWEWAHELMEERREKLLAQPGVAGVGLSFRLRGGHPTGQPCLTVYVRREAGRPELATAKGERPPKSVRQGKRRLPVEVVELGALKRHVSAGASLGELGAGERGTLGALAKDLDTGDTVAITAMHVTTFATFPAGGAPAPELISPMPGGQPFATLLQGTMTGTDAAKLALTVQQPPVSNLPPPIGTIKGWRPIAYPGDQGTPVKMFGAVSGFQTGYVVHPIASLPAESLDAAILVHVFSQGGDSGAALVDHEGLVLGFLVGEGGPQLQNLRVFTPASLVLATLRCDIPTA